MDARMQKRQMPRWLMCLFVMHLLLTSLGVLAREWCPNPSFYGYALRTSGISFGPYPTDMAALQAAVDAVQYGGNQRTTVISCNGQGVCTTCFNWISGCNNNASFWNGYDDFLNRNRLPSFNSLILPCDCRMLFHYTEAGLTTCTSFLSIILSGGTEVEPSSTSSINTLPIIVTVIDQNTNQPPTSPVRVRVSLKVDPKSGGHDHGDSTRPRGGIDTVRRCASDSECWSKQTDPNGNVEFNFKAPEASGKHTITVTCDGCSNTATKPVDVKVNGLETIPAFPYYTLVESNGDVIGATGEHSHNHNLLPAAAQVLMRIAVAYRFHPRLRVLDWQTNAMVSPPPLPVNDASLVWGGKFDIRGTWTGAHEEHRRGTSVDLRANENVGAIPPELFEEFEQRLREIIPGDAATERFLRECTPNERRTEANPSPIQHNRRPENYCVSQVDGSFDNNRHFHVRLMGE